MVVNVEIKNDPRDPGHDPGEAVAAEVARVVAEAGWTQRVIISSFQTSTLRAVRAADGRLPLGVLWPFLTNTEVAGPEAQAAGFEAVHPFVTEVSPELVRWAHGAGLAVAAWTVNAVHDLEAFVSLGVDTLITDHLAEAVAIAAAGAP
jgi:glycerophosphoryl diester phosphodiesterase